MENVAPIGITAGDVRKDFTKSFWKYSFVEGFYGCMHLFLAGRDPSEVVFRMTTSIQK
jgi:hypothetical protein